MALSTGKKATLKKIGIPVGAVFVLVISIVFGLKACKGDNKETNQPDTNDHEATITNPSDDPIDTFAPDIEEIITSKPDTIETENDTMSETTEPETESSTTEDESESVTEPPVTPDNGATGNAPDDGYTKEEIEEVSQNFTALIASLNVRVREYLASQNNSRCPTITGIEVVNISKQEDGYHFNLKVEGSYDSNNIVYFNLNAFNASYEGSNIYDLITLDSIDLSSALSQLNDLASSNNTEITSIKEVKQVEVSNKARVVKKFVPGLSGAEIAKAKVNTYAMARVQPAKGDFQYGNKVVIEIDSRIYITDLTIHSTKPLKTSEVEALFVQYLEGNSIASSTISLTVNTTEISKGNLNSALEEINSIVAGNNVTVPEDSTPSNNLEDDSIDLGL